MKTKPEIDFARAEEIEERHRRKADAMIGEMHRRRMELEAEIARLHERIRDADIDIAEAMRAEEHRRFEASKVVDLLWCYQREARQVEDAPACSYGDCEFAGEYVCDLCASPFCFDLTHGSPDLPGIRAGQTAKICAGCLHELQAAA